MKAPGQNKSKCFTLHIFLYIVYLVPGKICRQTARVAKANISKCRFHPVVIYPLLFLERMCNFHKSSPFLQPSGPRLIYAKNNPATMAAKTTAQTAALSATSEGEPVLPPPPLDVPFWCRTNISPVLSELNHRRPWESHARPTGRKHASGHFARSGVDRTSTAASVDDFWAEGSPLEVSKATDEMR